MKRVESGFAVVANLALAGLFVLAGSSTLLAQNPAYNLKIREVGGTGGNVVGVPGETFSAAIDLEATQGEIAGWSYGVCFGPGLETVAGTAQNGVEAQALNGGTGPGFLSLEIVNGGVVNGAVTSFNLSEIFDAGTYELATFDVKVSDTATPGSSTSLDICETLAIAPSPPVELSISLTFGTGEIPTVESLGVDIVNPNQFFLGTGNGVAGGTAEVSFSLANTVGIEALTVSAEYDPLFITLDSVLPVTPVDFFASQLGLPAGDIAFELIADTGGGGGTLPIVGAEGNLPVAVLSFSVAAAAAPTSIPVVFVDNVGSPPLVNQFEFNAGSLVAPGLNNGSVEIVNLNAFRRGECNNDGAVNIADGIFLLNNLFGSGPDPICDDACDHNDDGSLDITDSLFIWSYLLQSGAPLPPPLGAPGLDPTFGDGIGCNGDTDDL